MTQTHTTPREPARTAAARAHAQLLGGERRRARAARLGETLERRIESVRRVARANGRPSRIGPQLPKT